MITFDVITYLESDDELASLLGATAQDTKIYPVQSPHGETAPYITYNVIHEGSMEENMLEMSMVFDCISGSYESAKDVKDRVIFLLDKQYEIQKLLPSADYWIYWSKHVGGTGFKDPELDFFHDTAIFDFLYAGSGLRGFFDMLNKVMPIKVTGTPIDEEVIFNNFYFPGNVTVKKIGLHIRTVPTGSAITVDILKDDVEQGRIATLSAGSVGETTDIADISFLTTEKFGLKVKSVGLTVAGEDLTVIVHYQ